MVIVIICWQEIARVKAQSQVQETEMKKLNQVMQKLKTKLNYSSGEVLTVSREVPIQMEQETVLWVDVAVTLPSSHAVSFATYYFRLVNSLLCNLSYRNSQLSDEQGQLRDTIKENESTIVELNQQQFEREEKFAKLATKAKEREGKLIELSQLAKDNESVITSLSKQVENKEKKMASLVEKSKVQENKIAGLSEDGIKKDRKIKDICQDLKNKEKLLAESNRTAIENKEKTLELNEVIQARERRVRSLESRWVLWTVNCLR